MARELATLIGDLILSRAHPDRQSLQRTLRASLDACNADLRPRQPLEPTVGDEFQGGFDSVGAAARGSLLLRLRLMEGETPVDSRYGLGYGPITVFDDARVPKSQDGPGWWAARAAIERAEWLASSPKTAFVRTCFLPSPEVVRGGATNAFLICRDALVQQMSARQRQFLLGLLLGHTQAQLAADSGITQGAVSQALRRSAAYAVEAAQRSVEEVADCFS